MIDRPRPQRTAQAAPDTPPPPSTFALLLAAATRYWYLILICVLVAGAVGYGYGSTRPASYQATASIYFRCSTAASRIFDPGITSCDDDSARQTQRDQIDLPSVATRAADTLGPGWSTGAVQSAFSVDDSGQSNIVKVTATADRATDSARIANAVVDAAVAFRADSIRQDSLEQLKLLNQRINALSSGERAGTLGQTLIQQQARLRLAVASPGGDAEVAQRARVPSATVTPSAAKTTLLAAIFGLVLGVGLALLRTRFDPRVMFQGDFQQLWNLPVLATLPKDRVLAKGSFATASSPSLAPLGIARTSLRYLSTDRPANVVGFTSAVASEGKTTVTWGLASAAAGEGERVLLLELDLRNPSVQAAHGIAPSPGVGAYLRGEVGFEEIVRPGGEGTDLEFDVVPAGDAISAPLSLLRSDRVAQLFEAVRARYDLVIVDLPPVTLVPDALTIGRHLDAFAVVSRMRWVSPDEVLRERDLLDEIETDAPVLGVVINQNRGRVAPAYGSASGRGRR